MPITTRPTRKLANAGAIDTTIAPRANIMLETKIQVRGENIWHRRPASGEMLDMAICPEVSIHQEHCDPPTDKGVQCTRYAEVNQLASEKVLRSVAMTV